jgi:DNA ligase (NAD+)
MNIEGLSEKTLETLISLGYLKKFRDIYHLSDYKNELMHIEGFGKKSVEKLLESIEKSREVKLENFICALGLPNIGLSASKTIAKYCNGDFIKFVTLWGDGFDWTQLDDFGEVMAKSIDSYLTHNYADVIFLSQEMSFIIQEEKIAIDSVFTGKSICVTGKLNHFTRDSINDKITSIGAKVANSVSKKTDYLVTNEASCSSKYKKAVELGIPIITEEEFLNMCT